MAVVFPGRETDPAELDVRRAAQFGDRQVEDRSRRRASLGGILGGWRGAMAGVLIGGGGVVAATEGQDVDLAAGTVLRVRLDSPVTIK